MSKVPGIFERPAKSGIWWINFFDAEGHRHREKAGRRASAIDAVARRRREVKEGRFVSSRKGTRLTFRDLAKAAMVQKKLRLAPGSYEMDLIRLNKLLPLLGNLPADRLNTPRIEETMATLRKSVSNSTVNRYRAFMSSIYSWAERAGIMAFNPIKRVKPYKENDSRLRWLKDDEEILLRAAIGNEIHEAEFELALNTGMRRGEQFHLEWSKVDLERGILTVKGKTGRRHVVANDAAIAALKKLQAVSGEAKYVCPDASDEKKRDTRNWFHKACEKAKVLDFRFHDLRHTFASRLVMAGVDIRTVQELLGHKNIAQTMRYAHLSQDHRRAAVEKMNQAVPA